MEIKYKMFHSFVCRIHVLCCGIITRIPWDTTESGLLMTSSCTNIASKLLPIYSRRSTQSWRDWWWSWSSSCYSATWTRCSRAESRRTRWSSCASASYSCTRAPSGCASRTTWGCCSSSSSSCTAASSTTSRRRYGSRTAAPMSPRMIYRRYFTICYPNKNYDQCTVSDRTLLKSMLLSRRGPLTNITHCTFHIRYVNLQYKSV